MIADTAVLSTSPWHGDQYLNQDPPFPSQRFDSSVYDNDYADLSAEIERIRTESVELTSSGSTMSAGTSVASSECSDEPCIDYDGDSDSLFAVSEDQEYLTSSFYNMLDVGSVQVDCPFDWSDGDLDVQKEALLPEVNVEGLIHPPRSPQPKRKRSHSQSLTHHHQPWSKMTTAEQLSTIEELSDVISNKMGLREQIEVIRILNPSATVMPTDTEFVIDLKSLSDEKLARVREFVKQHTSRVESNSSSVSSRPHSSCQQQAAKQRRQLTKKQRKLPETEERQRRQKEHRQMMKEKRSGLFVKEQVLSLASGETDTMEEDYIDILT